MGKEQIRFPHKLLVGSVFFFLIGAGLLMVTTGLLPRYEDLWPIPLTLLGLLFLYMAHVKGEASWYTLPGILLSLSGFLLILQMVLFPSLSLEKFWPLFMTIAGVALLMYGKQLRARHRVAVLVPAVVIIILSLIFLPFSFDLIRQEFSTVVASWWPVLFLVLSTGLFAEFIKNKNE